MADLKDVIKSLVQQCNIESISTKDLTKELTTLYGQVEALERDKKAVSDANDVMRKQFLAAEDALRQYKTSHVDPLEKIKSDRIAFDREKFKFDVEKEFTKREVDIYKELIKSLTVTRGFNESFYGGNNGGSHTRNDTLDKPNLPNDSLVGKVQLP